MNSIPEPSVMDRLKLLKEKIEYGKTEKAKAEANIESYTRHKKELIAQLAELGVSPENLDDEITKLEQEIEDSIKRAFELLQEV